MHLQQLKRPTLAMRHAERSVSAMHVCHAHQSKQERPVPKSVNSPLLLSVYAALATACGTLNVAPAAAAVDLQQVQTGQEVVGIRPNLEVELATKHLKRSSPFQSALSSIVSVADTLSVATGELLDLTATRNCSSSNSCSGYAESVVVTSEVPTLHIHRRGMHRSAEQTLVSAALSATAGREQLQEADPYHLAAMNAAHQMSQQALAVASEALKLAALLESQEVVDPSCAALVQQIEAAARNVSVAAGDIAQPGVWLVVSDDQTAGDAIAEASAASTIITTSTPPSTVGGVPVGPGQASAPSLADGSMQL